MSELSVSGYCPHCQRFSYLSPAPIEVSDPRKEYELENARMIAGGTARSLTFYRQPNRGCWWIAKCNHCEGALLVLGRGAIIYPETLPEPVDDKIPSPMRDDIKEAKRCFTAAAYNASVVMARRALQSAALQHGAPCRQKDGRDASLASQLRWMQSEGHITTKQRISAEAIRWIGNHGAHEAAAETGGDEEPYVVDVTRDADAAITFVEELCRVLYGKPSASDVLTGSLVSCYAGWLHGACGCATSAG